MKTAQCNLADLTFHKNTKRLSGFSELFGGSFPNEILVKSNFTGNTINFVVDHAQAEAAEFWDGEMCVYIPTTHCNVTELCLSHAY